MLNYLVFVRRLNGLNSCDSYSGLYYYSDGHVEINKWPFLDHSTGQLLYSLKPFSTDCPRPTFNSIDSIGKNNK
jgi:hypothetical protein